MMHMMRSTLVVLTGFVWTVMTVDAQGWQPAARLWGAGMNPWVIRHPSGALLVPMRRRIDAEAGKTRLYDLRGLDTSSTPFEPWAPFTTVGWVGDANGVDGADVVAELIDGDVTVFLDALTPRMRTQSTVSPDGRAPELSNLTANIDADGDGIADIIGTGNRGWDDVALVSYGDTSRPWARHSSVTYTEVHEGLLKGVVIALGRLSGRMCMLKQVWVWTEGGNRVVYKLMELDAEDLRSRRDTVRTHLLRQLQSVAGNAYASPVIQFDSVWWVGAPNYNIRNMLRVTVDELSESFPDQSWMTMDRNTSFYEPYFYGQRRVLQSGPAVCRGDRAMLFSTTALDDTQKIGILRTAYVLCRDGNTLSVERPWFMSMVVGTYDLSAFNSATLTPDLDGDGLEDVLIYYQAEHPETRKASPVVDLFLTTGRLLSTVPEQMPPLATVRTLPDRWIITGLQRMESVPRQVPIYAADGRLVAMVGCVLTDTTATIPRPASVAASALFVVIAHVVVRVQ